MDSTPTTYVADHGQTVWSSTAEQSTYVASWWVRFFATLLDGLLIIVAILALVGMGYALDNDALRVAGAIGGVIVYVLYAPLMLALHHGQTLGKKVLSVKVVSRDNSPIGFSRAFVREVLFKLIPGFLSPFNLIDYLWAAFRGDRRSLHDLGARTVVIEDSRPVRARYPAMDERTEWQCTMCGNTAKGTCVRSLRHGAVAPLRWLWNFGSSPRDLTGGRTPKARNSGWPGSTTCTAAASPTS